MRKCSQLHGGEVPTGPDGSFELVGLPAAVWLRRGPPRTIISSARVPPRSPVPTNTAGFSTDPHICQPEFFHAIVAIDPAEGAESLTCDLALDPGRSRAGTVLDPGGKPLAGCVAINLCPATMSQHVDTLASEAFTAMALDPKAGAASVLPPRREEARRGRDGQGRRERAA